MTRLIICRHSNTFDKGDVVTRVGARTDLPLSSSGLEQAKFLAEQFSTQSSGFNFKRAYCSSLQRTKLTGDIILNKGGHSAKGLTSLPFLREIDYGIDENKSEEDVVKRLGLDAIKLWDEKAIPPEGWEVDPTDAPRKLRTAAFGQVDLTDDKITVVNWDKRELESL